MNTSRKLLKALIKINRTKNIGYTAFMDHVDLMIVTKIDEHKHFCAVKDTKSGIEITDIDGECYFFTSATPEFIAYLVDEFSWFVKG